MIRSLWTEPPGSESLIPQCAFGSAPSSVPEAGERNDFHPVGTCNGHLPAGQHNEEIRLAYRHLPFLCIVLPDKAPDLKKSSCTFCSPKASRPALDERVPPVLKMKDDISLQAVTVMKA